MRLAPLLACLILLTVSPADAGRTAASLSEVPALIREPAGQAIYREQMAGAPRADGFGAALPAGLTAADVLRLVAPQADPAAATLVGARPWPAHPGWYVAIACFADSPRARELALRYSEGRPTCQREGDADPSVHLGVLAYAKGARPTLVAGSRGPVDLRVRWTAADVPGPQDGEEHGDALTPEDYVRFDLARYRLNARETAFGMRVGWNVGYAGGGAYFEALALFRIDGARVVPILAQPMYTFQNLAGAWHEDGTRDHHIEEHLHVLTMLERETHGMRDLRIGRPGQAGRVFVWETGSARYVARPERRAR